ncbi:hypothetical protein [Reichenbachiella sp. MALMAid0571]|uniref:hypothetical protein n=1 Tax=Reichenbachiella sp. MALMAid0571 TaxID=3143939 RepID=UPI0032DF41AD
MNTELKAIMLLKSLIFHYHGLDEDEKKILDKSAEELKAHEELEWANGFIAEDYLSAFERSRDFLNKIIGHLPKEKRLGYLYSVWQDNNKKGYLTEMEATAMLNLARDWEIHKDLMNLIKE